MCGLYKQVFNINFLCRVERTIVPLHESHSTGVRYNGVFILIKIIENKYKYIDGRKCSNVVL